MKEYKNKIKSSLFDILKIIYPDSSNTTIRDLVKNKQVYVDNTLIVNAKKIVDEDQTVTINKKFIKDTHGIKIIYEDEDILIINKPYGMLSVPLDEEKKENALLILRNFYNSKNIFAVHRIDKLTSGIMMFAKNQKAQDKLNKMFKNHELKREYLAVVEGNLRKDRGVWKSCLAENSKYYVRSVKDESEGKLAETHFSVIRRSKNFTYLKLNLKTGRKHQIRVHCKDSGHPIVGDKRYSTVQSPILRMCLHAHLLAFAHPITGKYLSFTAPVPGQFKKLGIIN